MLNSTTITKAAGGVLIAALFLLLSSLASTKLFALNSGGHGETSDVAMMSAAPGGGAAEGAAPAEAAPVVALGEGDADKGAKVFAKCKACHKVDGKNATGPHLDGVVDRPIGSVADFGYSDALKTHGDNWTLEHLNAYLTSPKEYIPGNKMSFAGLPKAEDRANVIAYLQSLAH